MLKKIQGLDTFYCSYGDKGDYLLILHGWGVDTSTMMPIIRILSKNYRVIAFDFPFHGGTEMPGTDWTVKDFADFTLDFIKQMGIEGCHVLAHSFGARVAVEIASAKPDVFNRIILTGAAGIRRKATPIQKYRLYRYKFINVVLSLISKLPVLGKHVQRICDSHRRAHSSEDYLALKEGMHNTFKNIISHDQRALLPKIKNSVLLIWGRDDNETPLWMANVFNTEIQNSRLVIMQGGHFAFNSYPDAFCDFCLDFLEEA